MLGVLDPLPAARGRDLGQLPRRSRRAVDDDRGLLGAAPGRRRARCPPHAGRGELHPRPRRAAARARLHPCLAGAVRAVVLGAGAGAAAGDHPPARLGAAEHLRLRLLGAPDDRRPVARQRPTARSPAAVRPRRAAQLQAWEPRRPSSRRGRCLARLDSAVRAYERRPIGCFAGCRWPAPSAGSCAARRRTDRGAASSRPGSTR